METPPVISKTTVSKSLTKLSLTPCRRVGLGRPSSGSFQKIAQVRTVNTPLHISSISSRENSSTITQNKTNSTPAQDLNPHSVTHKHSFGLNKNFTRVRRCLTQDIKRISEESELETGYSLNETESDVGNCRRDTYLMEKPELKRLKMSKFESPNTNQSNAIKKENQSLLASKVSPIKEDIYSIGQDGDIPEKIILQLMSSLLEKKKKLDQLKVQDLYSKKVKPHIALLP